MKADSPQMKCRMPPSPQWLLVQSCRQVQHCRPILVVSSVLEYRYFPLNGSGLDFLLILVPREIAWMASVRGVLLQTILGSFSSRRFWFSSEAGDLPVSQHQTPSSTFAV